jgi:hypothetical protein
MDDFIDNELQSELSALHADNTQLQSIVDQVDDVLTDNWICPDNNNNYRQALHQLIGVNIKIALDPVVNGGEVLFTKDERQVLSRLLGGYTVGPRGREVLKKLRTGL